MTNLNFTRNPKSYTERSTGRRVKVIGKNSNDFEYIFEDSPHNTYLVAQSKFRKQFK